MGFYLGRAIFRKAWRLVHRGLLVCCAAVIVLIWLFVTPLFAPVAAAPPPDPPDAGAMVYVKGSVWLNGTGIPSSSALLPGDKVQTNGNAFANIRGSAMNLMVASDTLVNFQSGGMLLNRGLIAIDTGNIFTVHADFATIVPVGNKWTHFEVRRTEDEVRVLAGDAELHVTGSDGDIVMEPGEETVYAIDRHEPGALPQATNGTLNDVPWAKIGGSSAAGTILIWSLIHGDDPVSPWKP